MRRVLAIAENEFLALVRTKFFLAGLIFMPVLMAGVFAFANYAQREGDRQARPFAVVDRTGVLYDAIVEAAKEHNASMTLDNKATGPWFIPTRIDPSEGSAEDLDVTLSGRVRNGTLFAFIDIPADVLEPGPKDTPGYYSQNTTYRPLPVWLGNVLSDQVQQQRLRHAGIDPALVETLSARTALKTFGLVERRADGSITPAHQVDELQRFAAPMFLLVVMFMSIMSNAQHLINTIIEEKMSKISEVLLGSVTAFQLLMGKLLGIVVVSLLLSFVYLGGGIYSALALGRVDLVHWQLVLWFVVYLVCASAMFGSLFQALSSACSDLKDAQSMLQPAMMILIASYVVSFVVVRSPDSTLAVVLSMVPIFAPFVMLMRLALAPGPPAWQVAVSVVLLVASTLGTVWAAGRVFRVGLLMQGKPPNLPELVRWIRQ